MQPNLFTSLEQEFEQDFWPCVHRKRKDGKREALAAYIKARTGQRARGHLPRVAASKELLCGAMSMYVSTHASTKVEYLLYASTWLNQSRYDDEELQPRVREQVEPHESWKQFNGEVEKFKKEISEDRWLVYYATAKIERGSPNKLTPPKPIMAISITRNDGYRLDRIFGPTTVLGP